jgi:hypothetical protein
MMGLHQYKQGGGGFAQALCQPGGWLVSLEVGGGLQRRGGGGGGGGRGGPPSREEGGFRPGKKEGGSIWALTQHLPHHDTSLALEVVTSISVSQ